MSSMLKSACAVTLLLSVHVASANEEQWWIIRDGECQIPDRPPAEQIKTAKTLGWKTKVQDMKEKGKVVLIVLSQHWGSGGANLLFVRGQARCQTVLRELIDEMDKEVDPYR